MIKDNLINNIHKIFREDPWLNEIFRVSGLNLDDFFTNMNDVSNQYWFDSVTWALGFYEKLLGIKTNPNLSIEDRRSFIEAKWKSDGKADINLLQAVANSWKNGDINVTFENGNIKLTFIGEYGVPEDMETLIDALDSVKPAHLALIYAFKYLLVSDVEKLTISQLETKAINNFAF